jgi:hypothetical protein
MHVTCGCFFLMHSLGNTNTFRLSSPPPHRRFVCCPHRVHTEWHLPLSGVHSIMIVKSAQPGKCMGCKPGSPPSLYLPSRAKLWCTSRAAIFQLLRCPRIDSNEPIPPGCVAWRDGTTTLFLFGS